MHMALRAFLNKPADVHLVRWSKGPYWSALGEERARGWGEPVGWIGRLGCTWHYVHPFPGLHHPSGPSHARGGICYFVEYFLEYRVVGLEVVVVGLADGVGVRGAFAHAA